MSESPIVTVNGFVQLRGNGRRSDGAWQGFSVWYRSDTQTSHIEVGHVYLEDTEREVIQIDLGMKDGWPKHLTGQVIRQVCDYLRESARPCRVVQSRGVMVPNAKHPRTERDRHLITALKQAGFRHREVRQVEGITYWYGTKTIRQKILVTA